MTQNALDPSSVGWSQIVNFDISLGPNSAPETQILGLKTGCFEVWAQNNFHLLAATAFLWIHRIEDGSKTHFFMHKIKAIVRLSVIYRMGWPEGTHSSDDRGPWLLANEVGVHFLGITSAHTRIMVQKMIKLNVYKSTARKNSYLGCKDLLQNQLKERKISLPKSNIP